MCAKSGNIQSGDIRGVVEEEECGNESKEGKEAKGRTRVCRITKDILFTLLFRSRLLSTKILSRICYICCGGGTTADELSLARHHKGIQ